MKFLRAYLDTSVIGGSLDEEFTDDTQAFIQSTERGEIRPILSDILRAELEEAPPPVRDIFARFVHLGADLVLFDPAAHDLAEAYIAKGVITTGYRTDARHIALATVHRVDVLVSWNFKHMVNFRRIQAYNGVNLIQGYHPIDIRSPREVLTDDRSQIENL